WELGGEGAALAVAVEAPIPADGGDLGGQRLDERITRGRSRQRDPHRLEQSLVSVAMLDHDLGKPPNPEAFTPLDRKFLVACPRRCHRLAQLPSGSTPDPASRPDISRIRRGRAACASDPEGKGLPQLTRLVTHPVLYRRRHREWRAPRFARPPPAHGVRRCRLDALSSALWRPVITSSPDRGRDRLRRRRRS